MDLSLIFVETTSFPMMSVSGFPLARKGFDYVQFFEARRSEACACVSIMVYKLKISSSKLIVLK